MAIELICKEPVGKYSKGDHVKDPAEIATLSDVDHHFVRINSPDPDPVPAPTPTPPPVSGTEKK